MLPWLFPTYLFSSIGFLLFKSNKGAKWHAIVWMIILISTVSFMALAIAKPCHLEDGPGGLSALGLIPNLAVLILCLLVSVFAIYLRPKTSGFGGLYTFLTAVAWIALELALINLPWVWGYYNLKVHVVDWQGAPLANIKIEFLEEKIGISFDQAFLDDDAKTILFTDASGNVNYRANNYRAIFAMINYQGDRSNPSFGSTSFQLRPPDALLLISLGSRYQKLYICWSSKERQFGLPTEKDYTAVVPRPYPSTLTVYVPGPEGNDVSPY